MQGVGILTAPGEGLRLWGHSRYNDRSQALFRTSGRSLPDTRASNHTRSSHLLFVTLRRHYSPASPILARDRDMIRLITDEAFVIQHSVRRYRACSGRGVSMSSAHDPAQLCDSPAQWRLRHSNLQEPGTRTCSTTQIYIHLDVHHQGRARFIHAHTGDETR